MRTPFLVANFAACLVIGGLAQEKSESLDTDLRAAIAAWATAIDAGDAEPIAGYALDDAVFVSPSGVSLTKQARLDQIRKAKPRPASGSSDHRYQRFGDTLVHTYRQDGVNPQGQVIPTRQLQVWVRQSGDWRIAASQATYIAP
jgi:ketosteroid isomerase-like protein